MRPSPLRWLFLLTLLAANLQAAPLTSPEEPLCTRPGCRFFRFPVSWELMRSGFNAMDVALEAENYTEYWGILYLSPDEIELLTPRGRAQVTGITGQTDTPMGYPDILVVNEADFTRLLGLEPDPLAPGDKLVFLELPMHDTTEQSMALKSSLKYFVNVQLTLNF